MDGYGSIKQQNNPQMHYYGDYSGFMIMSRVITDLQREERMCKIIVTTMIL